MIEIHYMMTAEKREAQSSLQRKVYQTGHILKRKYCLWERETIIESGWNTGDEQEMRLRLVCHLLPSFYADKQKIRLVEAVQTGCRELWLEPGLAAQLSKDCPQSWQQPQTPEELVVFRAIYAAAGWRQRHGAIPSLVLCKPEPPEICVRMLAYLAEELNFLTLIGAKKECYEPLANVLWQEYGLPVRFLEKPVKGYPYGPAPLVLDMTPGGGKYRGIFSADAGYENIQAGTLRFLGRIAEIP